MFIDRENWWSEIGVADTLYVWVKGEEKEEEEYLYQEIKYL